ncbi:IS3 family transposase [Listeria aquatica]
MCQYNSSFFHKPSNRITKYIDFYQNKRYVPQFNGLTPIEFRKKRIKNS